MPKLVVKRALGILGCIRLRFARVRGGSIAKLIRISEMLHKRDWKRKEKWKSTG